MRGGALIPGPAAAGRGAAAARWFAPGRVNLLGGPDYNQALVLPFALRAGVYVTAARRADGRLVLRSRQAGLPPVTLDPAGLAPGSVAGWAAYPAGVAWALREAGWLAGGAELTVDADLPAGAGLSSSAALECAVALALTGLYGVAVPRPELAALARRAENDFAGVPTGIMDQLAALLCQPGHALLLDCQSGSGTQVPLDPARSGLALLVIDTGVPRALADGRYAARRRECQRAAAALGAGSLRDACGDPGRAGRLADPVLRRRCGHVVAEHGRLLAAVRLLRAGRVAEIGALLTASHRSLRDLFEVSWPQADEAVEAAVGAGAAGARLTGGGFGGCVVVLVPADRAAGIRAAVSARFAGLGWAAPRYLDATPAGAARRVR